jgi:hypothetical protein
MRCLLIGDAQANSGAIRLTFDGWCVAVGPADDLPRMNERSFCPVAGIAAAALGVGEIFAEFANLRITACRQVMSISLWRADLPLDHPDSLGKPIDELPAAVNIFGLGHLGQAYIWALAALPYASAGDATFHLCDDDRVEAANVETGALLSTSDIGHLKTRVAATWLEAQGFKTRLLERRIDRNYRRHGTDPVVALSGFDDNSARLWLAASAFTEVLDTGLGGDPMNFDTIAYRSWPNSRPATDLWPVEDETTRALRDQRRRDMIQANPAYRQLDASECGRLQLAGASIAVPFVGALSACLVVAELLKRLMGGPTFSEVKVRIGTLGTTRPLGRIAHLESPPIRGLRTARFLAS